MISFVKEKNPLKFFPFELDGHYNIEGYKIVAETIYNLTKEGILLDDSFKIKLRDYKWDPNI